MRIENFCYLEKIDLEQVSLVILQWQKQSQSIAIFALLPEQERLGIPHLQAVFKQLDIPLLGAVFPELVVDSSFKSCGIYLLCFNATPFYKLYPHIGTGGADAELAAANIADDCQLILQTSEQDATLFMICDALLPNIASLLDHLYLKLGNRIHYAGANAGSETFTSIPCLFDNQDLIANGILIILLQPHSGAVLEHGYIAPTQQLFATSTTDNCIQQIDWRPAFTVYQELVLEQFNIEITRENFYQYGVHYPFGIIRANGTLVVRIPVALTDDDSLCCIGEVPEHAILTLLNAPSVDQDKTIQILAQALQPIPEQSAHEFLLFYCAGRRLHTGLENSIAELQALKAQTAATQIAGALSLGEIGSSASWDYPLFQNATLVGMRW